MVFGCVFMLGVSERSCIYKNYTTCISSHFSIPGTSSSVLLYSDLMLEGCSVVGMYYSLSIPERSNGVKIG